MSGQDNKNNDDKRRYSRYDITIPVDCSGMHFLQSRKSRNISLGGIFIDTNMPEQPGTTIEMVFLFKEDWGRVKLKGRVVWAGDGGMGVEFIDPPADFIARIKELYKKWQE
ncbi:MAG: hypothetical protein COV72_02295 [Candidatus Omnitrophica bacterium CG11_big_fil_rev_8_21_14_0_20_42_13]|uniref:PilZ domain-containing protein n=1 Tax=Candidatus Ghiorseimicrobium undicola TaxID=1974746 RepID=A0A2H0LYW8_9BACT|nr:MAG: hypothetical protein COV72_02295 [Candidatus Omnitrophica bacterium CG11_big_fil_rev_8_21_14_0_20_42_13]